MDIQLNQLSLYVMPQKSCLVKSNKFIFVSFRCSDKKMRYPTGVKYNDVLTEAETIRLKKITTLIDNYSIEYDLLGKKIQKKDLEAYLDRHINPMRRPRKGGLDLVSVHKDMCRKMRSGELLKKKSKKRYSENSIAQYERMCERWQECAADPKSRFVLSFDMTIEMFRYMLIWLVNKGYSQNSIYNIVNNLRIFLKYTHEEGFHKNEVYKHRDFSVPQEDADAIAPTFDEVIKLYNTPFNRKSDEKARDLFVYGCFLALRVKDLDRINEYKLVGNFYEVLTEKTQKKVIIPCHWLCREIYDKYGGVLPRFHRQTFARILTRICKVAGITGQKLITMTAGGAKVEKYYDRWDLISPHSMRRFFATWMYRDLRRQPREIMPITGHESEESFFKYIKIEMEMNAQEIADLPEFRRPA